MKLTTADGIGLEFPYEMNSNLPFLFLDPEAPMAGLPGSLNLTLQHALTNMSNSRTYYWTKITT